VFYYFADHLGSSRVVTNATGTVCYEADFYPYGGERVVTNTCPQNYKFTGKERDAETGNDNFGARYYPNNLGRFLTPDPLMASGRASNPQTWNRYAYTLNNPLGFIDPRGLQEQSCATTDQECEKRRLAAKGKGRVTVTAGITILEPVTSDDRQARKQMSLSSKGLKFIERHESYSDKVYKDSAGIPTIGYGHVINKGEDFSKGITKEKGTELLSQDVKTAVDAANKDVKATLSQSQFDALVSFTYNVGPGGLGQSTLLENINAGNNVTGESFTDWNRAGGKVVEGLTTRRTDEFNLYSAGDYGDQ
jgi:RHS repeat-associated protein